MLISVIIPVYNAVKYIDRCIESVVNQSYRELEIIIINDGSTDGSLNKCIEWQRKDDRIILIDQKNCGQGPARNRGIEESHGQYIAFVDADDWIDVTTFEKAEQAVKKSMADIVLFDLYCVHFDNNENVVMYEPIRNQCSIEGNFTFEDDFSMFYKVSGSLCDAIWNRECFNDIIMPAHAYEDEFVVNKIFAEGYKVIHLNEHLYYYNLDNINNTTHNADSIKGLENCFIGLRDYLKKNKYYEAIYPMLRVRMLSVYRTLIQNVYDICIIRNKTIQELVNRAQKYIINEFPEKKFCIDKDKKCLLIGSYNLRLIIKRAFDIQNDRIDDFALSSLISCMQTKKKVDYNTWRINTGSVYEHNMIFKDRNNSLLDRLNSAAGNDYAYVLIDMLEELKNVICYNGEYISDNDKLSEQSDDCDYNVIDSCSDIYYELWQKAADILINKLMKLFKKEQVILIKNYCNYNILNMGDLLYSKCSDDRYRILMTKEYEPVIMRKKMSEILYSYKDSIICDKFDNISQIKLYNRWLDKLYSYIEKHYSGINIVHIPQEYEGTDKYFPVGVKPEYFNEAYYVQAADAIRIIDCRYQMKGNVQDANVR